MLLALEGAVFWEGKARAGGTVCRDLLLDRSSVVPAVTGVYSLCSGA